MIKEYTRPLEQGIDSDKNIFSVLELSLIQHLTLPTSITV